MTKLLQVFYALFSAFILAAAIPNELLLFGSPLLGLISLIPLYVAFSKAKTYTWAGFLFGLQMITAHVLSSYWLANFKDFAIFTLGASAIAYFIAGNFWGRLTFFAFYGNNSKSYRIQKMGYKYAYSVFFRIFTFASIWTLWEWCRSIGFLGYPWGTVLMSAYRMRIFTQIVDISGTWGITFLYAFFAAVTGEGLLIYADEIHTGKAYKLMYARTATVCILLFLCSSIYGAFQFTKERKPVKIIDTLIVQQNTDPWVAGSDNDVIRTAQNLTQKALAQTPEKPDLIVWPESILTNPLPYALPRYIEQPPQNPLIPFIKQIQTPLLLGGPVYEHKNRPRYYNSALFFDKNGIFIDYYAKMQLVPFAEIIPYEESVFVQNFLQAIVGFSSGWSQGKFLTLFEIPLKNGQKAIISAPICYEDAFPSVCRELFLAGSEVFINITNDSWSKTNSAEYQHFVIASYRAMEFRTTLVRATQSGYSVVVNSNGTVIADLPLFVEGTLRAQVPIFKRTVTTYARFHDWLPKLLIFCTVLIFIILKRWKKT